MSQRLWSAKMAITVLAVIGAALVAMAIGRRPSPTSDTNATVTPASTWAPPDVLAIWPDPLAGAGASAPREIQRALDEGDATLLWRTDPADVATRFAAVVLGWSDVTVQRLDRHPDRADGDASIELTACAPDEACAGASGIRLWLTQPVTVGDGGIWSVRRVFSPGLWVVPPAAGVMTTGDRVRFDMRIPDHRAAHIGIVAANACGPVSELRTGSPSGSATLRVPDLPADPACGDDAVGYAFVYAQDDVTVAVGDPLFEAAPMAPPWLTMIPLEIRSDAATSGAMPTGGAR